MGLCSVDQEFISIEDFIKNLKKEYNKEITAIDIDNLNKNKKIKIYYYFSIYKNILNLGGYSFQENKDISIHYRYEKFIPSSLDYDKGYLGEVVHYNGIRNYDLFYNLDPTIQELGVYNSNYGINEMYSYKDDFITISGNIFIEHKFENINKIIGVNNELTIAHSENELKSIVAEGYIEYKKYNDITFFDYYIGSDYLFNEDLDKIFLRDRYLAFRFIGEKGRLIKFENYGKQFIRREDITKIIIDLELLSVFNRRERALINKREIIELEIKNKNLNSTLEEKQKIILSLEKKNKQLIAQNNHLENIMKDKLILNYKTIIKGLLLVIERLRKSKNPQSLFLSNRSEITANALATAIENAVAEEPAPELDKMLSGRTIRARLSEVIKEIKNQ